MPMPPRTVPFSPPSITQIERDAVNRALSESRLSQGKYVEEFEAGLAAYSGLHHVVACNSGTSALHLAMLSLGIGPDDVVIVPELTYVASANAALYVGARVAFADVEPEKWQPTQRTVGWVLQSSPSPVNGRIVIVVVDLYGADNYNLASWALSEGHTVIYDAAHSMLVLPPSLLPVIQAHAERFAMTYSFFPSKHITTGEGGALLLAHRDLDTRARLYRGQGAPYPRSYFHSVLGYNYRMTDIAASLGIAQLSRIQSLQAHRAAVVYGYNDAFERIPRVRAQHIGVGGTPWVGAAVLACPSSSVVISTLRTEFLIDARPVFEVMSSLPHLRHGYHASGESVAREISARGILLPTYADMPADDVAYVVESLTTVLSRT